MAHGPGELVGLVSKNLRNMSLLLVTGITSLEGLQSVIVL